MPSHPRAGNRYVSVEEYEQLEARDETDANAAPSRPRPPGSISFKRMQEVRGYYARATASRTKSFGPTSFDVGGGMNDTSAFDACVESFGFVPSIVALKLVSRRAKECHAAYEARKAKERQAAAQRRAG
jgi:hypothetical protein